MGNKWGKPYECCRILRVSKPLFRTIANKSTNGVRKILSQKKAEKGGEGKRW